MRKKTKTSRRDGCLGAAITESVIIVTILAVGSIATLQEFSYSLKCKFAQASYQVGGGTESNTGFVPSCEDPRLWEIAQ